VRIWYQEYIRPAENVLNPGVASHQQLYRMYHSIAGEYDVVKQTPAHSRTDVNASHIQVNEFRFKAKDMVSAPCSPRSLARCRSSVPRLSATAPIHSLSEQLGGLFTDTQS
jgi:hypothetical protein